MIDWESYDSIIESANSLMKSVDNAFKHTMSADEFNTFFSLYQEEEKMWRLLESNSCFGVALVRPGIKLSDQQQKLLELQRTLRVRHSTRKMPEMEW